MFKTWASKSDISVFSALLNYTDCVSSFLLRLSGMNSFMQLYLFPIIVIRYQ